MDVPLSKETVVVSSLVSHRLCLETRFKLSFYHLNSVVEMVKDPVCNMVVDEKTAKWKTTLSGKTYYFCSAGCLEAFKKDLEKYAALKM